MGIFQYIISNFAENIKGFRYKSFKKKTKNNTPLTKGVTFLIKTVFILIIRQKPYRGNQ